MQCPVDGTQLMMTDRSGVEIDYCPQCRGVWLDRGELDKIIERAAGPAPAPAAAPAAARPAPMPEARRDDDRPRHRDDDDRRPPRYDDDHYYKRKKKGSFLDDLFDF